MMRFVQLLSRMPLWLHYFWADTLLFPLVYHVVRYRRKIVRKNLHNSFPQSSWAEIKKTERRFYHFFADLIVETIYGLTADQEEITHRVQFKHFELFEQPVHKTGGCIVMLGHYCNWEWLADYSNQLTDPEIKSYNIYRRLKNKFFDQLMIAIRHQRGGDVLEKGMALRHIITNKQQSIPCIYTFLSDQKPSANALDYWTTFLNQDTPMLTGAEAIARKTGFSVIYAHARRVRRGWYECEMEMICENPKQSQPHEITDLYVQKLESNIMEDPSLWLWTHNRWKFSRKTNNKESEK